MDAAFLKRVREGDAEAFGYFVEKYSGISFSLALGIVNNKADAEDVVQTSFLKAFKAISKFREDAKFSTWFFRIVVNESIQNNRKRKFKRNESDLSHQQLSDNSCHEGLIHDERKKILAQAMGKLDDREALLIRLFYLCELEINEIREVTGLSLSNCKVILHRARKKLRLILETQLAEEIHSIK